MPELVAPDVQRGTTTSPEDRVLEEANGGWLIATTRNLISNGVTHALRETDNRLLGLEHRIGVDSTLAEDVDETRLWRGPDYRSPSFIPPRTLPPGEVKYVR